MMLFFLVFAITTYKQSYDILLNEFSASSEHQLEITANTVDTHLKDMRYIIATLDKNSLAQAFLLTGIRKGCMRGLRIVCRNRFSLISTVIPPSIRST